MGFWASPSFSSAVTARLMGRPASIALGGSLRIWAYLGHGACGWRICRSPAGVGGIAERQRSQSSEALELTATETFNIAHNFPTNFPAIAGKM